MSGNLLDDIRRNCDIEVVAALKLVTDALGKLDVRADVTLSVNPVVLVGEQRLDLEAHDAVVGALDDGAVLHGLDVHLFPLSSEEVLDGGGGDAIELVVSSVLLLVLLIFVVRELDDRHLNLVEKLVLERSCVVHCHAFLLAGMASSLPPITKVYHRMNTYASRNSQKLTCN